MWLVIGIFVVYFGLVTWQMRRALRTYEPAARLEDMHGLAHAHSLRWMEESVKCGRFRWA